MPLILAAPFLLCIAAAAACAAYYAVVLSRMITSERWLPQLRDGLDHTLPETPPRVAIIVPAHNEQDVIERAARTLLTQDYPNLAIVFALDRCTDDTEPLLRAVIADDPRAHVLVNDHCPPDWAGKVHVLHRAARDVPAAQHADMLLFADADTAMDPACVRAAVGLIEQRRLDLLSLLPRLDCETWYERTVQPPAGFELIRQYPLDKVNTRDGSRGRPFANGQFLLFRADAYRAINGHESVREALLEDIAFAKQLFKAHRPAGVFMAGDLLRCRMYRSWEAFRRGWKRIYTESTTQRPDRLGKWGLRLRITGTLLPMSIPLCLLGIPFALAYRDAALTAGLAAVATAAFVLFLVAMSRVYAQYGLAPVHTLAYPIGAWLTADILADARRDLEQGVPTQWGGKTYTRTPRAKPPGKRTPRTHTP